MYLRRLKESDAIHMIEWMHDEEVVKDLDADFLEKNIDDALCFIKNSWSDKNNIHIAICDNNDEYLGTVSLKNINNNSAEFAIVIRTCAMGLGYSRYAMQQIINIASDNGINKIYWYVNPNNTRALRFYDKNGYNRVDYSMLIDVVGESCSEGELDYIWYLYNIMER